MAPPSSRSKPRNPQLQILFPKHLSALYGGQKREFELDVRDFDLSWLEYFRKLNPALYQEMAAKQNRLTIMDRRNPPIRQVWKFTSTVREFMDSFGRVLQSYKAEISTKPSNTDRRPAAQASSSNGHGSTSHFNGTPIHNRSKASNSNSPSTRNGASPAQDSGRNKLPSHSQTSTRSSARNKPGDSTKAPIPSSPNRLKRKTNDMGPPTGPPKRPHINGEELNLQLASGSHPGPSNGAQKKFPTHYGIPVLDLDDSASMAPSIDSQDSQDDLREKGVRIEEVKTDAMNRLRSQFNNTSFLRMKAELQGLMRNQMFFPAIRRLPVTGAMLQYIFRLSEEN